MTRERAPNVHRDRFGAMIDIIRLTDKQFKCRFRMNRMRYSALLVEIRQDLERNEAQAIRSSGEPVYPYLQLAIGLRLLAGGSYLDIADVYKVCCRVIACSSCTRWHLAYCCCLQVAESSVMEITWRVIDAINKNVPNVQFPFKRYRHFYPLMLNTPHFSLVCVITALKSFESTP